MNTATKLTASTAGLALAFAAALGVGSVVGPMGGSSVGEPAGPAVTDGAHGGSATTGHGETHSEEAGAAADLDRPGGLMVSERGYTLDLVHDTPPAGTTPVAFRVLGPDGAALTDYDVSHDEDLHLVAVRRDLSGFQHVHPERADDGTWMTPLSLDPGQWRVFADFDPAGPDEPLTLGADLAVAGDHRPQPLPEPSAVAEVDGYTVTLDGSLVPGQESVLTMSVARDGRAVTDLQPYLAAYGHLVVLRDGDLAYLHVHPDGAPGDGQTEPGPDITFVATTPSAGEYRLFLDFRHDGVVRTAELTVRADDVVRP